MSLCDYIFKSKYSYPIQLWFNFRVALSSFAVELERAELSIFVVLVICSSPFFFSLSSRIIEYKQPLV